MAPQDLVRLLIDKGVLTDPRVADAMMAVPRELFTDPIGAHGRPNSLIVNLPPLAALVLVAED